MLEFGYIRKYYWCSVFELIVFQLSMLRRFEGDQRRFLLVKEMKLFEFYLIVLEMQVIFGVCVVLEGFSFSIFQNKLMDFGFKVKVEKLIEQLQY